VGKICSPDPTLGFDMGHFELRSLRALDEILEKGNLAPETKIAQLRYALGQDINVASPGINSKLRETLQGLLNIADADDASTIIYNLTDKQVMYLCRELQKILKKTESTLTELGDFTFTNKEINELSLPETVLDVLGLPHHLPADVDAYHTQGDYANLVNSGVPLSPYKMLTEAAVSGGALMPDNLGELVFQFEDLKNGVLVSAASINYDWQACPVPTEEQVAAAESARVYARYAGRTATEIVEQIQLRVDAATNANDKAKLIITRDAVAQRAKFFKQLTRSYRFVFHRFNDARTNNRELNQQELAGIKLYIDSANLALNEATERSEEEWAALIQSAEKVDSTGRVVLTVSNLPVDFIKDASHFNGLMRALDTCEGSPIASVTEVKNKPQQPASQETTSFKVTTHEHGDVNVAYNEAAKAVMISGEYHASALVAAEAYKQSLLNHGLLRFSAEGRLEINPRHRDAESFGKIHSRDAQIELAAPDGKPLESAKEAEVRKAIDAAFEKVFGKELYSNQDKTTVDLETVKPTQSVNQNQMQLWRTAGRCSDGVASTASTASTAGDASPAAPAMTA